MSEKSKKISHSEQKKSTDGDVTRVHAAKHAKAAGAGATLKTTTTPHHKSHAHEASGDSARSTATHSTERHVPASWSTYQRQLSKFLQESRSLVTIVAVLVLVVLAYTVGIYLPNSPSAVYTKGVVNSGKLIDALVTYTQQLQSSPYKSMLFDGSMKGSDLLGHYVINLNGTENRDGDGLFSASGNVDGMTLSSNVRTVAVAGNSMPDAYTYSNGLNALQPIIGVQGLPSFDQFDGKWILVDHSLLETYLDNVMRIVDKDVSKNAPVPSPDLAQISDALISIQTVSKQYLLTTNSKTAVFKNPIFIGSEVDNGQQLYHYRVTFNSTHLAAYMQALGRALDGSQLNAWSQKVSQGMNLNQTLNLAAISQGVLQPTSTGNTGDIWIDRNAKIITKVQLNDPAPTISSMVIAQGYAGGKQYPFSITYGGTDINGATYTSAIDVTLDANTHATSISIDNDSHADGLHNTMSTSVSLTPSNNTVQVSTPAGAIPLLTALEPSGLSTLAKP